MAIVIVLGVSSAGVTVGFLAGMIVEGEIGRQFGSSRLENRIKGVKDHVIVCGFGRMDSLLVRHRADRGVPVVRAIKGDGGDTRFSPGANERIRADDTLILIRPPDAAQGLAELECLREAPADA